MKRLLAIFSLLFSLVLMSSNIGYAEIVTGRACIENGNISKAYEDARKDAMRSFVEEKIGVKIKSNTLVVNSMLVRDSILAKSDGYVEIKKVVSKHQRGDIYEVVLDLEVGANPIEAAFTEVPARLRAISEDSSRSGLHVAIISEDASDTEWINDYFTGVLQQAGFRAERNDDVVLFLSNNRFCTDSMRMRVETRRLGRIGDRGDINSIVRGSLELMKNAVKVENGLYRAVAQISCELIGYDNNNVDIVSYYHTAFAGTPEEAEYLAKAGALNTAAEKLSQQALKTNQMEYQGGVHNIKVTLIFKGIDNKAQQRRAIIDGLQAINCQVVRSAFLPDGSFQTFIKTVDFNNIEEIKNSILDNMYSVFPNIIDEPDPNNIGSTKIVFSLKG